jgi:hypothetical protein
MPIDDVYVDEPFYFSSSGSLKEILIKHTGTSALMENTVGDMTFTASGTNAKIGLVADSMTVLIDPVGKCLGVNTAAPGFLIDARSTALADIVVTETGSTVRTELASTSSRGFVGTLTSHPLRFLTNSIYCGEFLATGEFLVPSAYNAVIGGTNIDLHADNTGKIGPLPSSSRYKENIFPVQDAETAWVYDAQVKEFNFIGDSVKEIGIIAEDAELINPNAVRYEIYERSGENLVKLNRATCRMVKDEKDVVVNQDIEEQVHIAAPDGTETIETKTVRRIPEGINKGFVFYSILRELQKLEARVRVLEAT